MTFSIQTSSSIIEIAQITRSVELKLFPLLAVLKRKRYAPYIFVDEGTTAVAKQDLVRKF